VRDHCGRTRTFDPDDGVRDAVAAGFQNAAGQDGRPAWVLRDRRHGGVDLDSRATQRI
jgi:hypothetical protein